MALQTLDEVLEAFKAEGDWHLAQSVELYVTTRRPIETVTFPITACSRNPG